MEMSSEELQNLATENEALRSELLRLQRENEVKNQRTKIGLVWEHLTEAVDSKLIEEIPILTHVPKNDVSGKLPSTKSHLLVEGDNLHVLHTLQATHESQVDVIYIDPPYNTGKEFIYNDKLVSEEDQYRHSAWLSFMEKRLILAKNLLKDTGLVFISIDDHEQHRLHLLCDSIFGESNFIATFSWQNADTLKNDAKFVSPNSEAILLFAKDKTSLSKFRGVLKGEKQHKTYKNPDNDPRGPYLLTPLHAKSGNAANNFTFTFSNGQSWSPPAGTFHRFSKSSLEEMDREKILYLDPKKVRVPQKKTFLSEVSTRMPLWTFLRYEDFGSTRQSNKELQRILGQGKFPNPKPTTLIKKIIDAVSSDDAVILDFFAGSGTTLHAVAELNAEDGGTRQCILVTNNENQIARQVTLPRVKAILTGNWDEGTHDPLPGSLAYFQTAFMTRRKSLDRMRAEISMHAVDFVAVKHGTVNRVSKSPELTILFTTSLTIAVAPSPYSDHEELFKTSKSSVREGNGRLAYVFTWSEQGVEDEISKIWEGWDVRPLPAQMLSALRRLAQQPTLDGDMPEDTE
jgi:adenine-specific DNA-methyltransferase